MNDSDELSYVSSVDSFQAEERRPSVDAPDEKAIKRLLSVVDSQIELYHTISGMKRFDAEKFTAEEREALCSEYVQLLSGLKVIVINAIEGIKEARNGH